MNKRIASRILFLRQQKKLTQQQIADSTGLNRSSFNKIESGKENISIDTLDKICLALEISTAEFFNDSLFEKVIVSH